MPTLEVFDDIIDKSLQEKIKSTLFSDNFPWYFLPDLTSNEKENQSRHGFLHLFVDDNIENSEFYTTIRPILDNTAG